MICKIQCVKIAYIISLLAPQLIIPASLMKANRNSKQISKIRNRTNRYLTLSQILLFPWINCISGVKQSEIAINKFSSREPIAIVDLPAVRDPCNWNTLRSRISGGRGRRWWQGVRAASVAGQGEVSQDTKGGQSARWTRLKTGASAGRLLERPSRLTPAPLRSASASHQLFQPGGSTFHDKFQSRYLCGRRKCPAARVIFERQKNLASYAAESMLTLLTEVNSTPKMVKFLNKCTDF